MDCVSLVTQGICPKNGFGYLEKLILEVMPDFVA